MLDAAVSGPESHLCFTITFSSFFAIKINVHISIAQKLKTLCPPVVQRV